MDPNDGSGQKKRPHQMAPFAAGVLLWLEGHTVSDMQPLLHAHASQYRLVLMGPEKAVGTSWWGIADGPFGIFWSQHERP